MSKDIPRIRPTMAPAAGVMLLLLLLSSFVGFRSVGPRAAVPR